MAALYTGQINYLGSRILHGTDVRWLGTFAREQIPSLQHEKRPFALVVNTDVAAEPGEHWLALYAPRGSKRLSSLTHLAYPQISTPLTNPSFIILTVAFRTIAPRFAGTMLFSSSILDLAVIHSITPLSYSTVILPTPLLPAKCLIFLSLNYLMYIVPDKVAKLKIDKCIYILN